MLRLNLLVNLTQLYLIEINVPMYDYIDYLGILDKAPMVYNLHGVVTGKL